MALMRRGSPYLRTVIPTIKYCIGWYLPLDLAQKLGIVGIRLLTCEASPTLFVLRGASLFALVILSPFMCNGIWTDL